ncbi:MAG: diguanylate cyclase [Desulfobulbaceae bacterium]|nr:diguanylate cyclase [Desulfobulbaceae bacterium]
MLHWLKNNLPEQRRDSTEATVGHQLNRLLFAYSFPSVLVGQLAAIITFFVLYGRVSNVGVFLWITSVTLITLVRLLVIFTLKKHRYGVLWYTACAFTAGFSWAVLSVFYNPGMSVVLQVYILIILVGVPIGSIPAYALSRPVFFAFSGPILLALFYWSLYVLPELNFQFAALTIVYGAVLLITAREYHNSLRKSLANQIQKEFFVEELSSVNRQLEKLAYYDPLTGLANRRWIHEQMEKSLERSKRHDAILALMVIDLDNFKDVNDKLGHAAGDTLLVSVADRLRQALRLTDTVLKTQSATARIGGDEFIVLLEDIRGVQDAESAAGRILEKLDSPVQLGESEWTLSASVGIALFPEHGKDIDALLHKADRAMYRAKENGKNKFYIFS